LTTPGFKILLLLKIKNKNKKMFLHFPKYFGLLIFASDAVVDLK
jgi:hypothetical protein